jgi:hypothetical protein
VENPFHVALAKHQGFAFATMQKYATVHHKDLFKEKSVHSSPIVKKYYPGSQCWGIFPLYL